MAALDDILASIDMDQLAAQLGTDEQTARSAAEMAVPSLLGQIGVNASEPFGERSLAGALDQHFTANTLFNTESQVDLTAVDTTDGDKIVGHVFQGQPDTAIQVLSQRTGADPGLLSKLLPLLAPIVLSYLAQKVGGGSFGNVLGPILSGGNQRTGAQEQPGGNILGDILGQIIGRPQARADQNKGGGGLLDNLLGGLLGRN